MSLLGGARAQGQSSSSNLPVTNLLQLVQLLKSNERVVRDVQLEATVCAASDSAIGVMILQDATDTELVEFGSGEPEVSAGDRIRLEQKNCLLRRRDMGVQISALPVVDNDGIHAKSTSPGTIALKAGWHPLTIEWFNQLHDCFLQVAWQISNSPIEDIPSTALAHGASGEDSAAASFQPGLRAECYEGDWQQVPDFDLLKPAKSGIVGNFDLKFRTRDELVGLRFSGFINAPVNGVYTFATRSADGSLLFIGDPAVPVTKIGRDVVPKAALVTIDETVTNLDEQWWVSVEGRVGSISSMGRGLECKLYSQRNFTLVRIADANGLNTANLLNSQIRVTGVGCGIFNLRGGIMLGDVFVANARDVDVLGEPNPGLQSPPLLVKAVQVQDLSLEEAERHLPVRIRGVVTGVGRIFDQWLSIQDATRGIFVRLNAISNNLPVCGDFYEIIGHSGAGDFAPIVVADQIIRLGKGELPEPVHPTWEELNNGSLDVQWIEFKGLVTAVHSNTLSMLLPNGQIDVQVEGQAISSLWPLKKSVVQLRGVLYAMWNTNREVEVGKVLIRNSSIKMAIPAPTDPFDAVLKTPRNLLLFDEQASPFRRVKVVGQIIGADVARLFLQEDGAGLRLLPAEKNNLNAGDLVEAVGYPEISRTALTLREVILRKTGEAALPAAKTLTESELAQGDLDSTRVQIQGRLVGWHYDQGMPVLEMQSGHHLFFARLASKTTSRVSLRTGTRLALKGVYIGLGRSQGPNAEAEGFEIWLNSPADMAVLSQPSWWTLKRLLILLAGLLAALAFAAIWITQLRRLVERRTFQLHGEIHEREHAERQHALEAERSRIARDLHDDLGSNLTEISVLASTGQRPQRDEISRESLFHEIAGKARGLIAALDVIVWAVDPEDNSLQSLADYMTGHTEEFFSHTNISCRFKVPVTFPQITLDGRTRHDLLMAVKEALNNIVRHAEATEVEFRMAVVKSDLEIEIADNGKGFEGSRDGHGLKNLPARLLKLGGACVVESLVGGGTTVKIHLPLIASAGTTSGKD